MPRKNSITIVNIGNVDSGTDTSAIVKDSTIVELPGKCNSVMHNEDYTPMGFVVEILGGVFKKNHSDAIDLMLKIHTEGKGVAGTYTKSIAESKILLTREIAEKAGCNEFRVTMEKA